MISDEEKIIKYIMLSQMKGLGPMTQNILLDAFGGIEGCFSEDHVEQRLSDMNIRIAYKRLNTFIEQRNDETLRGQAEKIYTFSKSKGLEIIVREDARFPDRFRGIVDLPALLYCKGNLRINDFTDSIGIVGARRCSREGKEKAIEVAESVVNNNAAIVSGMAKGIDSYAHTAATKSGGYTVAVLGCGPDICYPKEHERLYGIISDKGCILSEYPPGTPPAAYRFPKRNRLIAALSDRLYVIDAGRHSGTASTIESGEKYGREVVVMDVRKAFHLQ